MTTSRRKDVLPSMHTHLERVEEEMPEFLDMASEVIKRWEQGIGALRPIVAEGLKQAYELGLQGARVGPEPVEGEAPATHRVKRTRAVEEKAPPATRVRRTRGSV